MRLLKNCTSLRVIICDYYEFNEWIYLRIYNCIKLNPCKATQTQRSGRELRADFVALRIVINNNSVSVDGVTTNAVISIKPVLEELHYSEP